MSDRFDQDSSTGPRYHTGAPNDDQSIVRGRLPLGREVNETPSSLVGKPVHEAGVGWPYSQNQVCYASSFIQIDRKVHQSTQVSPLQKGEPSETFSEDIRDVWQNAHTVCHSILEAYRAIDPRKLENLSIKAGHIAFAFGNMERHPDEFDSSHVESIKRMVYETSYLAYNAAFVVREWQKEGISQKMGPIWGKEQFDAEAQARVMLSEAKDLHRKNGCTCKPPQEWGIPRGEWR